MARDASGVSGAGKSPSDVTLYGNVNETLRAYGVGNHRHSPEILSRLGGASSPYKLSFVPHLAPMFRGMLATIYLEPAAGAGGPSLGAASASSLRRSEHFCFSSFQTSTRQEAPAFI